jgi:hypothetical protein
MRIFIRLEDKNFPPPSLPQVQKKVLGGGAKPAILSNYWITTPPFSLKYKKVLGGGNEIFTEQLSITAEIFSPDG